ncbi:hypothetical protein A3D69_01190 [Candidatus Uhrbacteria bacterium RIFCSPHIGHO2_02_FULL_54_11]|uniref:FecR protein domain-containing protein n=1 Tax=Candidatus Uhrbacteria bacterium GW2011_GWC2_53_7 TaxID=1618986 RepID=A0A0G2A3H3_9BACT|nr:MAG: hypothetical protein UY82_C0039G0007 [Candidatus Uhrbacteria bacterium GW2011_GWC2_53_7]OGL72731.1 MAG: hypothetical protein A3D69_01190 [Candidatus Uhrbacteria bacterium RIFCSPHIGHO2_02_FULL_54_11]
MNRILATLIIFIVAGLLISQSLDRGSNNSRVQGAIVALEGEGILRIRGEHDLKATVGNTLRRGEILKTGESWTVVEYAGVRIALAYNTELQLTSPGVFRLLGGRIMSSGSATITTPWIEVRSEDTVSVVNYAWKSEVDIIPLESATTVVDNETLGTLPVSLPSIWIENERDLVTSLEPFNPKTSSEAAFYAWAQERLWR